MAGKIALVTGASSGLGAHFARVLAAAGATVAIAARRTDRLQALVTELEETGATAMAVAMDVTSPESVEIALDQVAAQLGVVTVLINNAGVADAKYCLKVDEENWDFTMEANLKGAWRVALGVARRCAAAGQPGSIVNIASILGLRVGFGQSTYATSKAALVQLTKSLALELGAKGIRVNALCPGYFVTDMNESYLTSDTGRAMLEATPFGRSGNLSELDGPLLLLASDAGSFMTGTAVPVDGGHLVSSL